MKNRTISISLAVVLTLSVGLMGCAGERISEYSLTISSTEGGSVATPGEGTGSLAYGEGEAVNLVATPDEYYHFVNWSGDVDTIADVNAAETTITMNADCSITANFVKQYGLAISSTTGGSVTMPGEGMHTYDGGEVVNLVAKANKGYQFVNWAGNVHTIADVNTASTTITMNDNYSVIANFEAIAPAQYTLTISSTEGGSVTTPGQGTFRYDAGAVVDLVTESEEGYKFFDWTGDIETMADFNASSSTKHCQPPMHFSITMGGNYAITAHFIPRWVCPDIIEPGP